RARGQIRLSTLKLGQRLRYRGGGGSPPVRCERSWVSPRYCHNSSGECCFTQGSAQGGHGTWCPVEQCRREPNAVVSVAAASRSGLTHHSSGRAARAAKFRC